MRIISRKEAKAQGLKFYYTGKTCKHGHVDERYAGDGNCKTCRRERSKTEARIEYQKEYNKANREAILEKNKAYRKANRDKMNALEAKRKAAKLQRTPPWADLKAIEIFYKAANFASTICGVKFHVDHIVPLKGALVSGLHVHNNLQILTATDNISKNNKFEPMRN